MSSKKILISVTNDVSYDQRMIKTAISLKKFGYEVEIIGRMKPGSIEMNLTGFKAHRFQLIFNSGVFFYLEYNLRLFFYLLYAQADILCAVDLDTIVPNLLIGKIKKKPVVYDAHEYFTEVPELVGRGFKKSVWKRIERFAIPQCRAIYTVGESIAELFRKEYHRSIEVIYNFPLKNSIDHTKKKNSFIVLYQGDLNEGRGVDRFIESMHLIPNIELWIIGEGKERLQLENLTKVRNLESRVRFIGYVLPDKLKEFSVQAFLGINLLENKGLNYYYSVANKFFDYIQARVPVLTMNYPEYARFNEQFNTSILIPDLETTTIANAVQSLMKDEDKYTELAKNCDIASHFLNWETQEEKLRSIYHHVE